MVGSLPICMDSTLGCYHVVTEETAKEEPQKKTFGQKIRDFFKKLFGIMHTINKNENTSKVTNGTFTLTCFLGFCSLITNLLAFAEYTKTPCRFLCFTAIVYIHT